MTLFALGLGVGAFFASRALRSSGALRGTRARPFADLTPDPDDPVQGFDEVSDLTVSPLDVDALSNEDVETAQDLTALEVDIDDAEADGQNWVEALETHVIENGLAPDRPIADLGSGGRRGL